MTPMANERRKRNESRKSPTALRRLRAALTEERKRREFRQIYGREPSDDEELDLFIKELTLEMYNAGYDDWPPEQTDNASDRLS